MPPALRCSVLLIWDRNWVRSLAKGILPSLSRHLPPDAAQDPTSSTVPPAALAPGIVGLPPFGIMALSVRNLFCGPTLCPTTPRLAESSNGIDKVSASCR